MSRTIRTFVPLAGAANATVAAFLADPATWLPGARHVGPDRWRLTVGTATLERPVEVTIGHPWSIGDTWWRSWSWRPLPVPGDPVAVERLLPALDAELGLAVRDGGRVSLVLDGTYAPPGGPLGDALDVVALGRVAHVTLQRLLSDIGTALAGRLPVDQSTS